MLGNGKSTRELYSSRNDLRVSDKATHEDCVEDVIVCWSWEIPWLLILKHSCTGEGWTMENAGVVKMRAPRLHAREKGTVLVIG